MNRATHPYAGYRYPAEIISHAVWLYFLDLFLSYGSNPPLYPKWQEYFRKHQPPMLIAWGKNDQIFPPAGAEPYKHDLKTLDYHLIDAGHFALETDGDTIAKLMREFLGKHLAKN